jgi:SAM-dependent methyltransferase
VARSYTLYGCRACGSACFDPGEHDVDLPRVYEEHARCTLGGDPGSPPVSYYWRRQVEILTRLHAGPVRSVLDVGCRTGDFLLHWPAEVERVGVELSPRAAEIAERRGLRVLRGFVEDLGLARAFDVVGCYALIEHLREPLAFLDRLPALLNPGGVLAVLVPTRQCLKHTVLHLAGVHWHMYSPPQHLGFVSRRRLDEVLAGLGLRLVRRRYTSGGTFRPLARVPRLATLFDRVMLRLDHASPLNRVPLFDHMYSFYAKAP